MAITHCPHCGRSLTVQGMNRDYPPIWYPVQGTHYQSTDCQHCGKEVSTAPSAGHAPLNLSTAKADDMATALEQAAVNQTPISIHIGGALVMMMVTRYSINHGPHMGTTARAYTLTSARIDMEIQVII